MLLDNIISSLKSLYLFSVTKKVEDIDGEQFTYYISAMFNMAFWLDTSNSDEYRFVKGYLPSDFKSFKDITKTSSSCFSKSASINSIYRGLMVSIYDFYINSRYPELFDGSLKEVSEDDSVVHCIKNYGGIVSLYACTRDDEVSSYALTIKPTAVLPVIGFKVPKEDLEHALSSEEIGRYLTCNLELNSESLVDSEIRFGIQYFDIDSSISDDSVLLNYLCNVYKNTHKISDEDYKQAYVEFKESISK